MLISGSALEVDQQQLQLHRQIIRQPMCWNKEKQGSPRAILAASPAVSTSPRPCLLQLLLPGAYLVR